uniref:Uncharacterized protein LOC111126425 isoform X1 n=1 Tax=Crassostrea virginica TaxID=6565 RepID=A0A8B8DIH3_CRAVI|nr:uncharacterized protein LOC111126425 isoform X1 [Crassostrea virginica]
MNLCHLKFVVICFSGLFIFSACGDSGTEDAVVEGSGEITAHTDRVPVMEDELSATQVPANLSTSTRVEAPDDESKTKETEIVDGATVSGPNANKEAISSNIVFIIAPAVVGTVVVIVVIIAIIAIRRKGREKLQFITHGE